VKDRPRALAVLISVFFLGCILGSGGSYLWLRKSLNRERRDFQGQDFRRGPGPGPQSFQAMLSLSDEQEKKFMQILYDSRRQIDAVRAQYQPEIENTLAKQWPQIQAIMTATNGKLMSILNEEQKKEFESFLKEQENRRRHGPFGGRGMGPRPEGQQPPPPRPD
jgi:hypothetical protein